MQTSGIRRAWLSLTVAIWTLPSLLAQSVLMPSSASARADPSIQLIQNRNGGSYRSPPPTQSSPQPAYKPPPPPSVPAYRQSTPSRPIAPLSSSPRQSNSQGYLGPAVPPRSPTPALAMPNRSNGIEALRRNALQPRGSPMVLPQGQYFYSMRNRQAVVLSGAGLASPTSRLGGGSQNGFALARSRFLSETSGSNVSLKSGNSSTSAVRRIFSLDFNKATFRDQQGFTSRGNPTNDGFLNRSRVTRGIKVGQEVSRFGGNNGYYLSPSHVSLDARSMPTGSERLPYRTYVVMKPIRAQYGLAAPAYFKSGFGEQYRTRKTIEKLIREGYLVEKK